MKTLREAVPNIRTCSEIMDRMDEILVDRITMPRDRSRLKVYIEAPRRRHIVSNYLIRIVRPALNSCYGHA